MTPFDNAVVDSSNRFVKLPSLTDFDLAGVKLDLFRKYDPHIVSISEVEKKRKLGYEYQQQTFASLAGHCLVEAHTVSDQSVSTSRLPFTLAGTKRPLDRPSLGITPRLKRKYMSPAKLINQDQDLIRIG